MVLEGYRPTTLDIDLTYEVAPEHEGELVAAIRALKEELAVNVEEVTPAAFIPLPPGHGARHELVGRYGEVEVFHFDLYTTAVSKVSRGTEEDLEDVLTLLGDGRIGMDLLEEVFAQVHARAGQTLRLDPAELEAKFRTLRGRWERTGA